MLSNRNPSSVGPVSRITRGDALAGAPVKGILLSYFGWLSVLVSFPEIFGKSEACLPDKGVDKKCYPGCGYKEQY